MSPGPLAVLEGGGIPVTCADGRTVPYRDLDCAASTSSLVAVARQVREFVPWYSSVHRGAGYKSQVSTFAYERARASVLSFCGRQEREDVAIICRNTTEAINHLAYRLELDRKDVVATTVVEHHANLLPWGRIAERRWIDCERDGTFGVPSVAAALDAKPRPSLLAITGASNVTGWMPPITEICALAHERGVPVALDAAQLAPHRPIPTEPDFVAFSGHKMYAPFGAGTLIGPRTAFAAGDPFLAGGGAVDLVSTDEVIWTEPPEREEAGSPNVVGAVAFGAAMAEIEAIGWSAMEAHEHALGQQLRIGLAGIDGVRVLGPDVHHALVAARLATEYGIGVRHGCFCAHPYLMRLLGLGPEEIAQARAEVLAGDRRSIPGAVRASCGLGTSTDDVDALLDAVRQLAAGSPPSVPYSQNMAGDFVPEVDLPGWPPHTEDGAAACTKG
jgi:selenocysteine lyase/cysteine desulfurase